MWTSGVGQSAWQPPARMSGDSMHGRASAGARPRVARGEQAAFVKIILQFESKKPRVARGERQRAR